MINLRPLKFLFLLILLSLSETLVYGQNTFKNPTLELGVIKPNYRAFYGGFYPDFNNSGTIYAGLNFNQLFSENKISSSFFYGIGFYHFDGTSSTAIIGAQPLPCVNITCNGTAQVQVIDNLSVSYGYLDLNMGLSFRFSERTSSPIAKVGLQLSPRLYQSSNATFTITTYEFNNQTISSPTYADAETISSESRERSFDEPPPFGYGGFVELGFEYNKLGLALSKNYLALDFDGSYRSEWLLKLYYKF